MLYGGQISQGRINKERNDPDVIKNKMWEKDACEQSGSC